MSDTDRCPYCRESVAKDATVCSHCTREIAVLRAALAEISELKSRLAAAEAAAAAVQPGAAFLAMPATAGAVASVRTRAVSFGPVAAFALLWAFYLVPPILDYGFDSFPYTSYVTFALAALTGAALALYANTNVWIVLLLSFGQPYLPLAVLLASGKLSLGMIEDPRRYAVQIALVASLAALAGLAVFARGRLRSVFRWNWAARWMESHAARLELVQQLVLAALGVGGVLLSLFKALFG